MANPDFGIVCTDDSSIPVDSNDQSGHLSSVDPLCVDSVKIETYSRYKSERISGNTNADHDCVEMSESQSDQQSVLSPLIASPILVPRDSSNQYVIGECDPLQLVDIKESFERFQRDITNQPSATARRPFSPQSSTSDHSLSRTLMVNEDSLCDPLLQVADIGNVQNNRLEIREVSSTAEFQSVTSEAEERPRVPPQMTNRSPVLPTPAVNEISSISSCVQVSDMAPLVCQSDAGSRSQSSARKHMCLKCHVLIPKADMLEHAQFHNISTSVQSSQTHGTVTSIQDILSCIECSFKAANTAELCEHLKLHKIQESVHSGKVPPPTHTSRLSNIASPSLSYLSSYLSVAPTITNVPLVVTSDDNDETSDSRSSELVVQNDSNSLRSFPTPSCAMTSSSTPDIQIIASLQTDPNVNQRYFNSAPTSRLPHQQSITSLTLANLLTDTRGGSIPAAAPMPLSSFQPIDSSIKQSSQFTGGRCSTVTTNTANSPVVASLEIASNGKQPTLYLMSQSKGAPQQREAFSFSTLLRDMSQTAGSNITTIPQPHRLPSFQPAGHSINSPSRIDDSLRTAIHQSDIVQPTDDQSSTKNTRTSAPPSGFLGGQPNVLPSSTRVPVNLGPSMPLSHTLPLYRSTGSIRSQSFLGDSSEEPPILPHRNSLPSTSSTLLSPSRETSVIHPPISSTMRVLLDSETQSYHQPNLSTDNQALAQSQPPKANQSPLLIMTPANQTQGTGIGHTCGSSSIIQSHQLSHCSRCVELSANQEKSPDSSIVHFVPADEVQLSAPPKNSQTSIGTDRAQLSFLSRIDHLIQTNTKVLQSTQIARKNHPSTLSPSMICKNTLATPASSHARSLLRNTDPNPIPTSSVSFNLDLADRSVNQNSSTFHCANSAAPVRKNIDVAPARANSSNNLPKYRRTQNEMNTAVLENSDDPNDPDTIRRTYDLRNVASSQRKQNSPQKSHDSSSESESSATANPDYVPPSFHHSDDDSDNPDQVHKSRFVNSNAVPNIPLSTNSPVSASVTTYPRPTKIISQVTVGARSAANIVGKVTHVVTNPTQRILREANPTASNFLSTSCGITNRVSNISMVQSLPATHISEFCSKATNIPATVQNTDPKNSTHVATSSGIAKIIASVSVSTSPVVETFAEAHSRLTNSIPGISHSAIWMACLKPAEVVPQVTVGEYPAASCLGKRGSVSTNLIQSTLQDTNLTAGAPLVRERDPESMNPITATTTRYAPPTSTHLATCPGIPQIIPFFSGNLSSVDSLSAQAHFGPRNPIPSISQERNPTVSASLAAHPGSPNLVSSISGGQSSDASDRCKHLNAVPNTFQAMSSASNISEEARLDSRDPTPTTCHEENSTIAKSPLIAKSSENIQVDLSSAKSLHLDRVASDCLQVQQPGKSKDCTGKPSASSNVVLDISSSDDSVGSGDCDSDDPEIVFLNSNTSATAQRERASSMNSSDGSSYESGNSTFVDPDYVPPSREKLRLKTPDSVLQAIPSFEHWFRNKFVKDDSDPETSRSDHDCYLCSRKFDGPELLKEHRDKRYAELRCCKCFFRAASEKALKAHLNKHTRLKPYQCGECGQSFAKRSVYINHFLVHRNDFYYKCNVCGHGFNTYRPYEGHVNKHLNRRPYKCLKCTLSFTSKSLLHNHKKRVHKRKAFGQCPLCKKFISKFWLAHHMKGHEQKEVQRFLCDQCGRSFKTKLSLSRHNLQHTGERPHMCKYCGATFKVATALKQHERKHTGERPFKCDVCGKTFAYNTPYVYHLRTHTGERPYKCEFCDMTFAQPSPHAVHRRLHTGERPYKCKICPEAFPSHAAVRNHMQTHANAAKEGKSKRTRRSKAQIENEEDAENEDAPKPKKRRTRRAKAVVDDSSSQSEDGSEVVPTQSSRRSGRQTKCTRSLAEEDEDKSDS